ncbi:hypothetical protein [Sandaracinus amylolyticus]|uniref:Uncharacterized protein n=1 Tax=Sandaracinus amylolyticus TaxID=927083 RepID=A0A0F6W5M0_9BACT|nr:hypothetical protein [Sandaracinus amylolyticus]AKF08011.1 hypothetical protein DB32_005160 [Sandaracinus amylolyticus]
MSPRLLASLALVLALAPSPRAAAQLLDRASDTVRSDEPSRSSSSDDDSGSSSGSSSSDDDSTLGRASSTVRGDGGGRPRARYAPRRWYVEEQYAPSYGVYASGSVYVASDEPEPLLETMVVAQLEGSYVIDDVGRGTASVRVLLPWPAEIFAGYSLYLEPRERGETDFVALGRLGAAWRAVDDEAIQVRIGGSLRHWQDAEGARFGGEALAGVDMFPGEPLVLSFEGAAGIVGDAWVFEARGTIGVLMGPVELYAGWHHVALEATNGSGGVELTGPVGGLRLWL